MKLDEKKLSSRIAYDGKILRLTVDDVELPDGSRSVRECVRHSGGAAVLCVIKDRVLLVKQYRYLYGKAIYEIPAGKAEEGEEPSKAAARELEEETGYVAGELLPLLKLYPSPGYTDEVIYVYLAKNCRLNLQKLDDGEFLEVKLLKLDEVFQMIEGGEIADAKTVAAVYKYLYLKAIGAEV